MKVDTNYLSLTRHDPNPEQQFGALLSPHSASSDFIVRLFDIRTPPPPPPRLDLRISHGSSSLLAEDRGSDTLAIAGVDKVIRTFDPGFSNKSPLGPLLGHEYAARKIARSPYRGDVLMNPVTT